MPVCFVPGCKSGLKSCIEKRRFFFAPKEATDNVLVKGAFEEVMNLIISQDLPRVGCDEHYEKFVCNSIYDYFLLRFKAIAKRKKQEKFEANNAKRHANRKLSKI